MASQKPPVAFVSSVTLIFSFAAALALAGGAADTAAVGAAVLADGGAGGGAEDPAAVGAAVLADGAAVGPALPLHAAMSMPAAPSPTNAFNRVDMCVAPSCRIVLVVSAARAVRPGW